MNNFTRFFLSLIVVAVGFTASAQYDIEATSISVTATPGNQVYPGYESPVDYQITNTGTADLTMNDRYSRAIVVDGTPVIGPDTFIFGVDIPAGTSSDFTVSGGAFLHDFGTTAGDQNVCVVVALVDSTEDDLFNNDACQVYTVSTGVNNDWSCDTVVISNWQDIDGHTVIDGDPADEVDTLNITLTNHGVLTYYAGSDFSVTISNGVDSIDFDGVLNTDVDSNETTTIVYPSTLGIPDVLQTNGTHDMCVRIRQINDNNSSNDRACTQYRIKVPPPTGVNDPLAAVDYNVYMAQNAIYVDGIQTTAMVTVMDASGKMITQQMIESNDRIPANDLASGVYIVRVTSEDNATVHTQRLVKN